MIIVIDYKAGNLTSVKLALEALGAEACVTRDPADLGAADRIIFPGVGAAESAMATLASMGWIDPLKDVVRQGVPFLGICLGMQIVFEHSVEDGGVDGLGLVKGTVRRFAPAETGVKVPHMGWNRVRHQRAHPVLAGVADGSEFYFVHSYYPDPSDRDGVLGITDYAGISFASMVACGNLVATQFHPEKSGRIGLRLLRNFLAWEGDAAVC